MNDKSFPKYGCHVDGLEGERCVLDPLSELYVDEDGCDVIKQESLTENTYHKCSYWKLVKEKQTYFEHTCPCCGHQFNS